jgi:hypothetical protein
VPLNDHEPIPPSDSICMSTRSLPVFSPRAFRFFLQAIAPEPAQ